MPVFNAELYLKKSITSVLEQDYQSIEFIIINDGSTDSSTNIINEFTEIDERIKTLEIANSGPANARNKGIDIATGSYILFLDADDYLNEKALSTALNAPTTDIVIFDFKKIIHGELQASLNNTSLPQDITLNRNELASFALKYLQAPNRNPLFAYSWGRLFRKEIIDQHQIRFNAEMSTFEDVKFNFDYLKHCNSIHYIDQALYYHLIHDGFSSATMSIGSQPEKLFDFTHAIFSLEEALKNIRPQQSYIKEVGHAMTTLTIIQCIRMCGQLNMSNFWSIYHSIRQFAKRAEIQTCFKHYKAEKGNSKLIPFALKHGLIFACLIVCKFKSAKRYKKGKK